MTIQTPIEQNALLYERQVILLNKVDQIYKLMQRVIQQEQDLLQPLCEKLRELFLSDITTVLYVGLHEKSAFVRAQVGLFNNQYPAEGNIYSVIENLLPDFRAKRYFLWHKTNPDFLTPILSNYHIKHAIFLPILSSSSVYMGWLALYRSYDDPFIQDDIALLVDIASRVGDYLYTQQVRAEESQQLKMLETMNNLVLELNRSVTSVEELPTKVKDSVVELFHCEVNVVSVPVTRFKSDGVRQLSEIGEIEKQAWSSCVEDDWHAGILSDIKQQTVLIVPQKVLKVFEVAVFNMFWNYVINLRNNLVLHHRLQWLATHDTLTGATNRHAFMEALKTSIEANPDETLCIALFDIDDFKRINDAFGHFAGDKVLQQLTNRVSAQLNQESDSYFARHGGEEFVIAIRCSIERFTQICSRILEGISQHPFLLKERTIPVTISIGVTYTDHVVSIDDIPRLLQQADTAMYRAKAGGKNRMCSAL